MISGHLEWALEANKYALFMLHNYGLCPQNSFSGYHLQTTNFILETPGWSLCIVLVTDLRSYPTM